NAQAAGAPTAPKAATARRTLPTPDWMALDGEIVDVQCGQGPEVTITVAMPKGPMGFHTKDYRRVGVSGVSEATVPKFESCRGWKGRRVKIWFRWVQGQDWVGEMTKIYFF